MKPANKLLSILTALAFSGTLAVAATSAPVSAHSAKKALPVLHWNNLAGLGGGQWVSTLDPAEEEDTVSQSAIFMVYGSLVQLLPNGNPAPDLAAPLGHKVSKASKPCYCAILSKNKLTWTFHLRKGLHFGNGAKILAQNFKWSIARGLLPEMKSPVALYYESYIKGAAAVASGPKNETMNQAMNKLTGVKFNNKARTVSVTTTKQTPFFLRAFTYPTVDVVNPKAVSAPEKGNTTELTNSCKRDNQNATGPFLFKCLNNHSDAGHSSYFPSGQTPSMTFVPNKRFVGWGGKPKFELTTKVIDSSDTAYTDFKSGGLDATGIPSEDISDAHSTAKSTGDHFIKSSTSVVVYLSPNEAKGYAFHFKPCRLVLAYGINRDAMAAVVGHTQQPIYDVLPPNIPGYYKGSNNPHYNPGKAQSEVTACLKATHKSSLTFDLPYATGSQDADNEFKVVQANLNSLRNVKVTLKPLNSQDYFHVIGQNLNNTKTAISQAGWQEDFPDGWDYCTLLLRSGENYDIGNYKSTAYNKLVDKAATTFSQKTRSQLYIKAQHLAVASGAWISLTNGVGYGIIARHVKGFTATAAYAFFIPNHLNWAQVKL